MSTSTTAIFPPPALLEPTDFGVKKSHKLIGIRSDQFNPHFLKSVSDHYTNDYSTASVIDMSKNVNIAQYSYTHHFDWILEVMGEPPVQAGALHRLEFRTNEQLNAAMSPTNIHPRTTWFNRIQQLLIVKVKNQELVYLVKEGQFELHGRIEHQFNSIKCKMIRNHLRYHRAGEGFFCNLHPDRRGLEITDSYSVFLLDKRENAITLPEHVVYQVAKFVLTP